MKLTQLLFRASKKTRSVSRSDPLSFSSGSSSDLPTTPNSVLIKSKSHDISSLDFSSEINYQLEQAFKLIDKDGDGKINRRELEMLLSRVGPEPPSQEELTLMLTEIDRDGDGCISLEEFSAISSAFEPACGSELRDVFNFFDADRNGKISAEELRGVFEAIGDDKCTLEDCRRMIAVVDSDCDGFVCFRDFSRLMEQQERL
ncbi:hypothetical protein GIB67_031848 [Kingdonia uniflora]|uniref:EF-hand domain-containing protein n=1 Tax=Kingdonia uniflora TaxID=39325 RepID=A0A7J7L4R3_9MAGN|nr:hypothetical protein GIB67_031848 [Kingdonia uniflora]